MVGLGNLVEVIDSFYSKGVVYVFGLISALISESSYVYDNVEESLGLICSSSEVFEDAVRSINDFIGHVRVKFGDEFDDVRFELLKYVLGKYLDSLGKACRDIIGGFSVGDRRRLRDVCRFILEYASRSSSLRESFDRLSSGESLYVSLDVDTLNHDLNLLLDTSEVDYHRILIKSMLAVKGPGLNNVSILPYSLRFIVEEAERSKLSVPTIGELVKLVDTLRARGDVQVLSYLDGVERGLFKSFYGVEPELIGRSIEAKRLILSSKLKILASDLRRVLDRVFYEEALNVLTSWRTKFKKDGFFAALVKDEYNLIKDVYLIVWGRGSPPVYIRYYPWLRNIKFNENQVNIYVFNCDFNFNFPEYMKKYASEVKGLAVVGVSDRRVKCKVIVRRPLMGLILARLLNMLIKSLKEGIAFEYKPKRGVLEGKVKYSEEISKLVRLWRFRIPTIRIPQATMVREETEISETRIEAARVNVDVLKESAARALEKLGFKVRLDEYIGLGFGKIDILAVKNLEDNVNFIVYVSCRDYVRGDDVKFECDKASSITPKPALKIILAGTFENEAKEALSREGFIPLEVKGEICEERRSEIEDYVYRRLSEIIAEKRRRTTVRVKPPEAASLVKILKELEDTMNKIKSLLSELAIVLKGYTTSS